MKRSTALTIAGIVSILAGIFALVFPLPASIAVTIFVGWSFLLSGVLGLWAAFSSPGLADRGWVGFVSFLNLVVGVWMLANPLAGMISLTVMVGALFVASGATRIYVGLTRLGASAARWPVVLSGVISLFLGGYILTALPATGIVTLGLLVAIELIVVGASFLAAATMLRRIGQG